MFGKTYDQRLLVWSNFRKSLETSEDPIQDTIDFYKASPNVSINTDPWDKTRWPSPWELVEENQYCEFCTVLGICYSLQLTDRFSQTQFEIHISVDTKTSSTHYLLFVGDTVIGYPDNESIIHVNDLPDSISTKKIYCMNETQ